MAIASLILPPGTTLGGYRIDDVVGIGGMAVVYRAEQLTLGRSVALKVLTQELSRDPVFRERFRREGQHVAALEHPNIIPIYDAAEDDGRLYLATRLIDGDTLAERMLNGGLSADQTLAILGPIADALDVAHRADVIHRDIKPQNILLTQRDHPFLADFGVAKSAAGHGLTATGNFLGSVSYASPEQIRGESLASASDIYSLTAVLYQCLTGHVPFPRDTDAGVMHAHLSEPPPALPAEAGPVQDVIARGMAKLPEHRHGTAGELLHDAERALAALPGLQRRAVPTFPASPSSTEPVDPAPGDGEFTIAVDATAHDRRRTPATAPVEPPQPKRRWWMIAAALAAFAIVATAATVLLTSSRKADTPRTAQSGPLMITYGASWEASPAPGGAPVAIVGMQLLDPLVMSDAHVADVVVRIGKLGNVGAQAGALPARSSRALTKAPKPETARLGRLVGSRYRGRIDGGGSAQLWIFPTTKGEMVVACTVQSSPLGACDTAVTDARLIAGHPVAPGPDRALAARLDTVLKPIAASRAKAPLVRRDVRARSAAARSLASTDRRASRALRALQPTAFDAKAVASLATALAQESRGLARLARAATARDRAAYVRATSTVRTAGPKVRRGLTSLRRLGYTVGRAASLTVPAPPKRRARVKAKAAIPAPVSAPAPTPAPVAPAPTPAPIKPKRSPPPDDGYGPVVVAPAQ